VHSANFVRDHGELLEHGLGDRTPAGAAGHSRADRARERRDANPVEVIVVLTVVAAFLAFEVWFFFFAGPVAGS
jgi:hypothetical protein